MTEPLPTSLLLDGDFLPRAIAGLPPNEKLAIVLLISRREVEQFDVGSVVDRLMTMSDEESLTRRLEDSMILSVDGYNEDLRELHEIPAVVRFVRAVAAQWNGWFHFLNLASGSLGVLLRLLVDVESLPQAAVGNMRFAAVRNPEQARRLLLHMFAGMNALYERCGYSDDRNARRTDAIVEAFGRALGD